MEILGIDLWYTTDGYNFDFKMLPARDVQLPTLGLRIAEQQLPGGKRIDFSLIPQTAARIRKFEIALLLSNRKYNSVFINGFQSWTESREYGPKTRLRGLNPVGKFLHIDKYGDYHFKKTVNRCRDPYSYTYTYIRQQDGSMFFTGSLDEAEGYTLLFFSASKAVLTVSKDCDGTILSEASVFSSLLILEGEENDIFRTYWELSAEHIESSYASFDKRNVTLSGWTSWYNYYTQISEECILSNLEHLRREQIPIQVFQIDDGYQKAVGDWLETNSRFPGGMKSLALKIKDAGFLPGLWLAPFLCEKDSEVYTNHPDWLLRDRNGNAVPAGWNPNWNGTFYALDISVPEVIAYLRMVFDTIIQEWGFRLLKLDFLYAAALEPGIGRNRGQIMHDAMRFLRQCTGGALLLGCGVPLGSSFPYVDICRLGGDVALKWEDKLLKMIGYRERVSTVNSLRSTIGRRHMSPEAFLEDPDVFILRDENNQLNRTQKYTLFLTNNIFGRLLFTSDDISTYGEAEKILYRSMFPLLPKIIHTVQQAGDFYRVLFSITGFTYTAFINLSGRKNEWPLEPGFYYESISGPDSGNRFLQGGNSVLCGPYQSRCFFHIPREDFHPAGSTRYLFPGSEISSLETGEQGISVSQHEDAPRPNTVFLTVPDEGRYTVNGTEITAESPCSGLRVVKITL